jgi:hypothetical protein
LITAAQIKAARKLLGWRVSGNTVGKAEGAFPGMPPTPDQLDAIKEALEAAGIEFTDGDEPGVKLKVAVTRAALRP